MGEDERDMKITCNGCEVRTIEYIDVLDGEDSPIKDITITFTGKIDEDIFAEESKFANEYLELVRVALSKMTDEEWREVFTKTEL